jgi:hypothetical protein
MVKGAAGAHFICGHGALSASLGKVRLAVDRAKKIIVLVLVRMR